MRCPVLGDHAHQLVLDSHRSSQTRTLLSPSTALLTSLLRESHSLSASLETASTVFSSALSPDPGTSASLIISALALGRNFRAVVVHHSQRLEILKERFWAKGGVLSAAFGEKTETRKHMCPADEEFVKAYSELCLQFKTSWYGDDLAVDMEDDGDPPCQLMDATDLLGGGVGGPPPKELMVSVRVVDDVGDVETPSGARLNLSKGSQYYLAREDVENLLVQGFLEIID